MSTPTWKSPPYVPNGNPWTATEISDSGDDLTLLGTPPKWMLQNVLSQAIPNATVTPVTMSAVIEDTDGFFNSGVSVSAVTIPANFGAIYDIDAYCTFDLGANGIRWIALYINGSAMHRFVPCTSPTGNPGEYPTVGGHVAWPLNAGDVVELRCFQNSGAGKNILGSAPELAIFNGIWRSN